MRITVDRATCTSLGICESMAPEVFEVDEDGELLILRENVPESERALMEQAVAGCPTAALAIEDD